MQKLSYSPINIIRKAEALDIFRDILFSQIAL